MRFPHSKHQPQITIWFDLHCFYGNVKQVPDTHRIPRTSPVYLIPHTVICSEAWPSWASAQWPRRASYAIAIHAINQWAPPMAAPPAWTPITRSSIGTTWVQNHQSQLYSYICIVPIAQLFIRKSAWSARTKRARSNITTILLLSPSRHKRWSTWKVIL